MFFGNYCVDKWKFHKIRHKFTQIVHKKFRTENQTSFVKNKCKKSTKENWDFSDLSPKKFCDGTNDQSHCINFLKLVTHKKKIRHKFTQNFRNKISWEHSGIIFITIKKRQKL